ncbi:MAG: hypothetical protein NC120_04065 [Ruminococcus sp.]|nr:hypothetical protein [Ruminococcus sp.]
MNKLIKRFFAVLAAAALAVQCLAVTVSAFTVSIESYGYTSYFYYKGVYYSFDTDASNVAQKDGGSSSYTTVLSSKVPTRCVEKWLDPITWRIFDTRYQAEVEYGVGEAHLIFVDPNYKEEPEKTETKTSDENTKKPAAQTVKPAAPNNSKAAAAKDGEPYILGKKTQAGWSTVSEKASKLTKGSLTVVMNGCEVIDKSVLEAMKDRNVTVVFSFSSGVTWRINGKTVTEPKNIDVSVEYNTKAISSALADKVSENAETKTQITLSDNEEAFGCTANITVRFNKKRAGLDASAYSYDSDKQSLKKVSASQVNADGNCTFSANKGGSYLIVLRAAEDE